MMSDAPMASAPVPTPISVVEIMTGSSSKSSLKNMSIIMAAAASIRPPATTLRGFSRMASGVATALARRLAMAMGTSFTPASSVPSPLTSCSHWESM